MLRPRSARKLAHRFFRLVVEHLEDRTTPSFAAPVDYGIGNAALSPRVTKQAIDTYLAPLLLGRDPFVLHDHDARRCHVFASRSGAEKISVTSVPFRELSSMLARSWSANVRTSRRPSDRVVQKPTFSGSPTPSSATIRLILPSPAGRISTRIAPSRTLTTTPASTRRWWQLWTDRVGCRNATIPDRSCG